MGPAQLRILPESRVVVATGNRHKVEEIRLALAFTGWEFIAADVAGVWLEPAETGATFLENARIKARVAVERFGLPALADDSGLEVDALDGLPGVRSRYYAGLAASDAENNERLLSMLGGVPPEARTARFRSVVVMLTPQGVELVAEGTCEGRICDEPRGASGFGYDPLFCPEAVPGMTMAELPIDAKNALSHRGSALRALAAALDPAS